MGTVSFVPPRNFAGWKCSYVTFIGAVSILKVWWSWLTKPTMIFYLTIKINIKRIVKKKAN